MEETLLRRGLRYSIIDGAFAAAMGSLAGGIFLMGFALKILKANPQDIGLLAALPMFANLIQLLGSYIIEKTGKKKALCVVAATASRLLWLFVILLPLKIFDAFADFRVWILVAVIGFSSLLGSLSGIGWSAWMGELVPADIRGSYFGKRNMISSAAGLVAVLAAGKFVSVLNFQTGISSGADFLMIEVDRASGFLKKLDAATDNMADKSENAIESALDKLEDALDGPVKKIKKFFRED